MPFEAGIDGDTVQIHTQGRARGLELSWPTRLRYPQLTLDGTEHLAYVGGTPGGKSGIMRLSTRDGDHELLIRPRVWPKSWSIGFPYPANRKAR